MLYINIEFKSPYIKKINSHTERMNSKILQMLRFHVSYHQKYWEAYVQELMWEYDTAIHRLNGFVKFYLFLYRPPITLDISVESQIVKEISQENIAALIHRM